ncbi:hypothetical protein ES319_A06G101500v1 [Gossypium barbadense]|uniref:Peptidase S9 prolyl oligopeptidase catalytic domain-containing protein n=2 Tax=Gossypium TaxID=3633 RepID=A0A5J5VBS3_GOSBA|nr:hypothetical protein ES319_A06G101500v1 [Gossypium barbadense]TYH13046.1 hypothetical protein ES288_A06G113300v1 [Gossypium darwinii]
MTNIISSSSISPLICFFVFFFWLGHGGALGIQHSAPAINGADKIRSQFLHLLRTRRSPQVPLTVEPSKPARHPLFQQVPTPTFSEAMESCPKADIKNLKQRLREENFYLHTEALVSSWIKGDTMPFLFDTVIPPFSLVDCKSLFLPFSSYCSKKVRDLKVWDLIKLADYLTQRKDIDPKRIGITGESLGGMHAWFAAFVDTRYAVAAPIIGVQGFRWAIDNDKWQARVDSIKAVFEEARIDLGKCAIDKEVVKKVWDRIAPGLASIFDSPYSIPAIAPRPLLLLNGADDPRCPLDGIKTPTKRARKAYAKAHSSNNVKLIVQPGIGHEMTSLMVKEASDWMDRFLKQ